MAPNNEPMLEAWVVTPRALAQALHEVCPLKQVVHDENRCPRMERYMETARDTLKRAGEFDTARMTANTRDEWEAAR